MPIQLCPDKLKTITEGTGKQTEFCPHLYSDSLIFFPSTNLVTPLMLSHWFMLVFLGRIIYHKLKKHTWKSNPPPDFPFYFLPATQVQDCVKIALHQPNVKCLLWENGSSTWLWCHSPGVTHPVFPMQTTRKLSVASFVHGSPFTSWRCTWDQGCYKHDF